VYRCLKNKVRVLAAFAIVVLLFATVGCSTAKQTANEGDDAFKSQNWDAAVYHLPLAERLLGGRRIDELPTDQHDRPARPLRNADRGSEIRGQACDGRMPIARTTPRPPPRSGESPQLHARPVARGVGPLSMSRSTRLSCWRSAAR